MLPDSHRRALQAAVRLALTTSALHGCTRPASEAPAASQPPAPSQAHDQPAPTQASPEQAPEAEPKAEPEPITSVPNCEQRLDEAFPAPRGYEAEPVLAQVDAVVGLCCAELLGGEQGPSGSHRWDCCYSTAAADPKVVIDPQLVERASHAAACTPWGPPVPPGRRWYPHSQRHAGPSAILDLRRPAQAHRPELRRSRELDGLRPAAVATWRARMVNEHGSARVFEALAEQLEGLQMWPQAREARGFASEERRHGVQCAAVVEALGGQAVAARKAPEPMPVHDDAATPTEAMLRNLASICCMSETVAVALIGAERLQMPKGSLRDLLDQILADEVGHARFGWRMLDLLLPRLDAAALGRLGAYLQVAFAHLVEHELSHLPADVRPPALGVEYGLCNGEDARRLLFETIEHAIIPGFEARGIPAARAWRESLAPSPA